MLAKDAGQPFRYSKSAQQKSGQISNRECKMLNIFSYINKKRVRAKKVRGWYSNQQIPLKISLFPRGPGKRSILNPADCIARRTLPLAQ